MKIVLEFDNIESFFSQLPRFASLMNFSGQFANITQKPKTATEPTLDEPDLPVIERPEPGVTRVHGTKTETAEEAVEARGTGRGGRGSRGAHGGPAEGPARRQGEEVDREADPGRGARTGPAGGRTGGQRHRRPQGYEQAH